MELVLNTTDGLKKIDTGDVIAIHSDPLNHRIVYVLQDTSTAIEEFVTESEYLVKVEDNFKKYTNRT